MKLRIHAACANDTFVSVAGNIFKNDYKEFVMEFTPEQFYYLFVADGDNRMKGQAVAEAALEHLRDSFTMGDIQAQSADSDLFAQIKYIAEECNALYPHLKEDEHCGAAICGVMGNDGSLITVNASNGLAYILHNYILEPVTEQTTPIGYNDPEATEEVGVWEMNGQLQEGDVLIICSNGITDLLSDDEIGETASCSTHPAKQLLADALERDNTAPAAVIAVKIGGGEFVEPFINEDDLTDDTGAYDAWA
ncbi:MAG: SpoIIE family protein phosphatase [Alistipes sp.]|nr:SpoIIE family protein phosphatase [Alistipes sp.]